MKGLVVYYSATGSTKKIAKAIWEGMKGVIETDLASVKEISPQAVAGYDVIGIGAPIWYFREPANVRLFIYNMPSLEGKMCFTFCTHGTAPFGIFYSMVPALQKKGLTIIGWADWYGGVEQVLHAVKPYFTDGHPDEIDLKEAETFGREMAERALRVAAGEKDLIPEIRRGSKAEPTFRPPHTPGEEVGSGDSFFEPPPRPQRKVNLEKCRYPGCTACMDNCIVRAIDFSVSPPVFKKSCINCSLCDRICPEEAIEIDEETIKFHRTQKKIDMTRCIYPECTLCVDHCPMNSIDFSVNPPVFKNNCEGDDLCWVICPKGAIEITNLELTHGKLYNASVQSREKHPFLQYLAEAEAEGKFRRLVPMEDIGWDTPVFKSQKLPRFVIDE
ncbi:4Fe-4S dicluster domain-containing protein [Moorella sulfitireducens]|uniref:4Fe-4S dicluster domain-containing protein n=1 Tax=Neomoorella sulfitireducens TaxID=2972948 RepID=UPI0021ABFEA8|nr:4Fe-4S dicluster domain-containing protein [Moorella sulfitireducens]